MLSHMNCTEVKELESLLDSYILTLDTVNPNDIWTVDKIKNLTSYLTSNGVTVLPCSPGEVVYRVTNLYNGEVILVDGIILEVSFTYERGENKARFYFWANPDESHTSREYSIWCEFSELGKSVFKNKEDAIIELNRRRSHSNEQCR